MTSGTSTGETVDFRMAVTAGECATQAEGWVNGLPFYFQYRRGQWQVRWPPLARLDQTWDHETVWADNAWQMRVHDSDPGDVPLDPGQIPPLVFRAYRAYLTALAKGEDNAESLEGPPDHAG